MRSRSSIPWFQWFDTGENVSMEQTLFSFFRASASALRSGAGTDAVSPVGFRKMEVGLIDGAGSALAGPR